MAITVLPRNYNPWVQALPSFVQNMALQGISQKFQTQQKEQLETLRKQALKEERGYQTKQLEEARVYAKEQRELDESFKLKTTKDLEPVEQENLPADTPNVYDPVSKKFYIKSKKPDTTNQIKNYNMAMQQYLGGKAEYPGTFSDYTKAQSRAGATRIGIGQREKEKEILSEVDIRKIVKSPELRNKTINSLRQNDPDWDVKDKYVQEEEIFKDMNRQIQVAYKGKAVFDEERNPPGWYVGNKLVRAWKDPFKHRRDKLR